MLFAFTSKPYPFKKKVIRLLDYQVKETCVKLVMDYMDYDLRTFYENMPTPLKNSKV